MYCKKCGNLMDDTAVLCPSCGAPTDNYRPQTPKAKVWPLVIGILSIVFFMFIIFQSCAVGVANTLEANGEGSGMAGLMVSLLYLAGGIVLIATRRSASRIAPFIIYLIAALIGILLSGSFGDLEIWGFLALVVAVVCLVSTIRSRKKKAKEPEID